MPSIKQIPIIGVASCIGGSEETCHTAPDAFRLSPEIKRLKEQGIELYWQDILSQDFLTADKLRELVKINYGIASNIAQLTLQDKPFLVISGDHSSAMGTWAGAQNGLKKIGFKDNRELQLGLIWLDAHLDAHTLHSSPSGNFHGMPISAILGCAEPALLNAYPSLHYFSPSQLLMYGIRSYEMGEKQLLDELGVRHWEFEVCSAMMRHKEQFLKACQQLCKRVDVIGISLDLDILDPFEAPGVETAVPNGLKKSYLLDILAGIKQFAGDKLIGLEISEFNPVNDRKRKTEKAIADIVIEVFAQ